MEIHMRGARPTPIATQAGTIDIADRDMITADTYRPMTRIEDIVCTIGEDPIIVSRFA